MKIDNCTIKTTNFEFPGQKSLYHGKVRDVYTLQDKLVIVATDRISAFDHILPKPIPYKGQVLNQIAYHFLRATEDIVPNWLTAVPDPNVSIGHKAIPIKIEMVIRGYLAGHAWREYNKGIRVLCGETMPEGMKQNDKFSIPIVTPTTKAEKGHDLDISREEIISSGLISLEEWKILERFTRLLFKRGTEMAKKQGLILVDTKYEFGKVGNNIFLIDEIHTPDSSRYFYSDVYEKNQASGQSQRQLSKEFVREWLMDKGFEGKEGQTIPEMPDEFVWEISDRYIELYELITGENFKKADVNNMQHRIFKNVSDYFSENK
jgi:phosphoribosylaminoimidazole-succinocarboxamide synthase